MLAERGGEKKRGWGKQFVEMAEQSAQLLFFELRNAPFNFVAIYVTSECVRYYGWH